MKVNTFSKIGIFRIVYLVLSLAVCALTGYLLVDSIVSHLHRALDFKSTVNLFALLLALLFEAGIVMFIFRSMRSQTLLMKHLVFKADGTPYRPGVLSTALGGAAMTAIAVFFFLSAGVPSLLPEMERDMRLFIADVALIFALNLDATFAYFLLFRHESGTFALI